MKAGTFFAHCTFMNNNLAADSQTASALCKGNGEGSANCNQEKSQIYNNKAPVTFSHYYYYYIFLSYSEAFFKYATRLTLINVVNKCR